MTERYSKSNKTAHRRLMEFIELKIQEAETLGIPIPVTDCPNKTEGSGYPQVPTAVAKGSTTPLKAKAKPKGKPQRHHLSEFPETEALSEMDDSWSEAEFNPPTDVQADVMVLQSRMVNLETMLQQVLHRLSPQ